MAKRRKKRKRGINPAQIYKAYHWGQPHTAEYEVGDPDLPDELVEWGKLIDLEIDVSADLDGSDTGTITFPRVKTNILCFDPYDEKLYVVLSRTTLGKMRARFRAPGAQDHDLRAIAQHAGGSHAGGYYPKVKAQALGPIEHMVYHTDKGEEKDALDYIHHAGEESGVRPWLAIDKHGRLWVVGGNYRCEIEGITD